MTEFRQIAILVEGQTEAQFVSTVLGPFLLQSYGIYAQPIVVHTSRLADGTTFRGGGGWKHYELQLRTLLRSTNFRCVSVLIDFYGYPHDAPGANCCTRPHQPRTCAAVRAGAMADAISHQRFVSNIVLHEFETWVIAASLDRDNILGDRRVAEALRAEAVEVSNDVELLNDSPQTAPSKRVFRRWPDYQKVTDGVAVIEEAGLQAVIDRCPGLRAWIDRLAAC
jgi:hypothetical protein